MSLAVVFGVKYAASKHNLSVLLLQLTCVDEQGEGSYSHSANKYTFESEKVVIILTRYF